MPKNNSKKSKRGAGQRNQPLQIFKSIAPSARRVRLSYSSNFQMAETAAGTGAFRVFRLNSIYDPDYSGVGTSAAGYSQMMTLYTHYRVNAAGFKLEAFIGGASGVVGFAPLMNQVTMNVNANTWRLLPYSKYALLSLNTSGGKNIANISGHFPLARMLGLTPAQYSTEMDYAAAAGANPTKNVYIAAFVQGIQGASVATASMVVTVEYDVEFFNPLPLYD
jgi:hypothetical protein